MKVESGRAKGESVDKAFGLDLEIKIAGMRTSAESRRQACADFRSSPFSILLLSASSTLL